MADRDLTAGEWAALSHGLTRALSGAEARPRIRATAHPAACLAALWRGATPILTRGDVIWWPTAPGDLAASAPAMAVLQHELQHVLDYAEGWLTAAGYLTGPHHWRYGYKLNGTATWTKFGAEQRAMAAEHIWLMEHGFAPRQGLTRLRKLVPWAG